jgi:hypothetical protein
MYGYSFTPNIDAYPHPWTERQIQRENDNTLLALVDGIHARLSQPDGFSGTGRGGDMLSTGKTIAMILEERGVPIPRFRIRGSAPMLATMFQDTSSGYRMQQPQQSDIFRFRTPSPRRIIHSASPRPAHTLVQAPERPARLHVYDRWGNLTESRDETEDEKKDREYEEWKKTNPQ